MVEFSVLISVYDKDNPVFFEESLKSIYNQSVIPNQTVLVIDGEVNNEILKVISNYSNKSNFKVVQLKDNKGLAVALNKGLNECDYNWVARMDSDDICEFDRFKRQTTYILNNTNVDILGGHIDEYDETMKLKIASRLLPTHDKEIKKMSRFRCPVNHVSVFYKKDKILKLGGYPSQLRKLQDYGLWSKAIMENYTFYNLPHSLVKVRTGSELIKRRGGLSYLKNEIKLLQFQKKIKFLNNYQFIFNLLIRTTLRLSPAFIRSFVYKLNRN